MAGVWRLPEDRPELAGVFGRSATCGAGTGTTAQAGRQRTLQLVIEQLG
jgi:hypothetical protein